MFEKELGVRRLLGPTELKLENSRYDVGNETADQLVTDRNTGKKGGTERGRTV